MSTNQCQCYKCSEFLIDKPHFDSLAKQIQAKSKESASKHFVNNYYTQLGYPQNHRIYIEEDGTIYFFDVKATIDIKIEQSGTINNQN